MKQGDVRTNATEHATSAHGTATELATSGPSPFYATKLKERMYDDASLERRRQEQVAQARKRIEARQKNKTAEAEKEKDASDAVPPRTREQSSPKVDMSEAEKWMMQDDGQETGAADGVHAGSSADHATATEHAESIMIGQDVRADPSRDQGKAQQVRFCPQTALPTQKEELEHVRTGHLRPSHYNTSVSSGAASENAEDVRPQDSLTSPGTATEHDPAADGVHAGSSADHAIPEVPKPVEERMFQNLKKDVLDPLYAACTVDQDTNEWIVPAEETRLKIDRFYWHRALGDAFPHNKTILSCTAKFFLLEVDHNRDFKPRLDIVLTFSNESGASSSSSQTQLSVRYHPGAKLIWSNDPQPSEAMQQRMKLAAKKMNFKL